MRINRDKIKEILEGLWRRDAETRGAQPELALGCFYSLNVGETKSICEKCPNYDYTCRHYLGGFEINDNPFEKHRQEIYKKMNDGKKY